YQPAYFEFMLRSLPRRGAEKDFPGRLWAGRNSQGPVWRIELDGGPRFLVQDGPHAAVWRTSGAGVERAPLGVPLIPDLDITPFDLLMPYFYWPDARAVGVDRVLGRPADVFVFRPPADFGAQVPGLAEVRAYLDGEYHAPLQVESLGPAGSVFKTLTLVDLKRVAGQVLPKDIDVRDEATRNKTRFSLTAVELGVDLSPALFTPASLTEAVAPPAGPIERF
ncbi:MAG: outer membrane lipoprotein-sorting protein, partial [Opitutaceae bacterium]